jgi:dTDP-4-dehydrorhamnose reductase
MTGCGKGALVTGGSGLLGRHLQKVLSEALFPSSSDFDVRNPQQMTAYLAAQQVDTIIHCAAVTSPPRVDANPIEALDVNIVGTANVVRLCAQLGFRLIYISTDYVFDGEKGLYTEEDPVKPVNKYAWSKLGGETAARMIGGSLVVRVSFGPVPFPYDKAFVDQWTSREPVHVIAAKIARLAGSDLCGLIHIGGPRKTVMEYAKGVSPEKDIGPLSRDQVAFAAPKDTSLDVSKFNKHCDVNPK